MTGRMALGLASLAVVLALATAELGACGDKFLRFGRTPRRDAYAAVRPASVLLYLPASAEQSDGREFEAVLSRAGHRPLSVRGTAAFLDVIGTTKYDIVIANYLDAQLLKPRAASAPSRPQVLPIVYKPKKPILADIKREFGHVLVEGSSRWEMLAEIDHVMKDR